MTEKKGTPINELNLFQKLLKIQAELKAPKGQFNKFGNYKYRSLEDINESVKPLNEKYGVFVSIVDDIITIGDDTRFYVQATATAINVDKPIETHSVKAYAREEQTKKGMDGAQITGSVSSYARKYAMNALYLIDDTKDPDTDEQHKQTNSYQSPRVNQGKEIAEPTANIADAINQKYAQIKSLNKGFDTNEKINEFIKERGKYEDLRKVDKKEIIAWLGKLQVMLTTERPN